LLDNRVLNSQYGAAAKKRVVREFSLELMVSRTVQLYDDVVNVAREPAEIFPEQVTAPGF
jgi:hypothetical protein